MIGSLDTDIDFGRYRVLAALGPNCWTITAKNAPDLMVGIDSAGTATISMMRYEPKMPEGLKGQIRLVWSRHILFQASIETRKADRATDLRFGAWVLAEIQASTSHDVEWTHGNHDDAREAVEALAETIGADINFAAGNDHQPTTLIVNNPNAGRPAIADDIEAWFAPMGDKRVPTSAGNGKWHDFPWTTRDTQPCETYGKKLTQPSAHELLSSIATLAAFYDKAALDLKIPPETVEARLRELQGWRRPWL